MNILQYLKAPFVWWSLNKEQRHFWDIVIEELIGDDETFKWLLRNDFMLHEAEPKFTKFDLVSLHEILDGRSVTEIEDYLYEDFSKALQDLLSKNSVNVEELITIFVNVDSDMFKDDKGIESVHMFFEVNIVWNRYFEWLEASDMYRKSWWFYIPMIITLLSTLGYFVLK